jgi:hypothetical protein
VALQKVQNGRRGQQLHRRVEFRVFEFFDSEVLSFEFLWLLVTGDVTDR